MDGLRADVGQVSMTLPEDTRRPDSDASIVARCEAIIVELRAQNAALVAWVAQLECQVGVE